MTKDKYTAKENDLPGQRFLREYLNHFKRELTCPSVTRTSSKRGCLSSQERTKTTLANDGLRSTLRAIFEGLEQPRLLLPGGDKKILPNLYMDRVDYCTFGNTRPSGSASSISTTTTTTTFTSRKRCIPHLRIGTRTTLSPTKSFHADRETLVEEPIRFRR